MHEKRNFVLVLLLIGSIVWAAVAWFIFRAEQTLVWPQRLVSLLILLGASGWLFYAFRFEDKLPDYLKQVVGEYYYEADGLSFMPMIRVRHGQAELCVYYQNRYENPVEAIVHLRPPSLGQSFIIQPGVRDVHFAFRAGGGDFGVIHQPIAVPRQIRGEMIEVKMAASSWYPRSQGQCLRRKPGRPAGSLQVDWVGNALKAGVHQVSGEIPLHNPVTLHMTLPEGSSDQVLYSDIWRQEQLASGEVLVV
jgi:hypothetical protein